MKSIKLASENQEYTNGVSVSYIYTYTGKKPVQIGGMSSYVQSLAKEAGYAVSDNGVIQVNGAKHTAMNGTYGAPVYALAGTIFSPGILGEVQIPVLVKSVNKKAQGRDFETINKRCDEAILAAKEAVEGLFQFCLPEEAYYKQNKRLTGILLKEQVNRLQHTFCVLVHFNI